MNAVVDIVYQLYTKYKLFEYDCFYIISVIFSHKIKCKLYEQTNIAIIITAKGNFDLLSNLSTSQGGSSNGSADKHEHLYKILVIGELGTGKTSLIKRYVHQFFSQHYRATIGVDFALKVLNWDTNTIIRLQLWDIAGIVIYNLNLIISFAII